MFAKISKEQYDTFLTGKIPDSIPQEMKASLAHEEEAVDLKMTLHQHKN